MHRIRIEYPLTSFTTCIVDWTLLPALTFLYLLSFLDRTSVGNAKLQGLLKDIHVTDTSDYNTALALYFVGYAIFEIPALIVLKRTNPRFLLPILTIAFGITSTLQGLVTNKAGFYCARFFLGVSEAGSFAGCVFVFSMFYKRNERHFRVGLFFGGAALSGAFGGILAWAIGHMSNVGSKPSWAWIFFLEGSFTVLVGLSAFFWIPNYPKNSTFLNEREKEILLHRLSVDNDESEVFEWSQVGKCFLYNVLYEFTLLTLFSSNYSVAAFTDHLVIAYALLYHAFAFPLYSLSLFLPTIIGQLGYASWQAQLLTTPIYLASFLGIIFVCNASHRTNKRGLWIIISGFVAIIGYIVVLSVSSAGSRYAGVFIAAVGVYGANG